MEAEQMNKLIVAFIAGAFLAGSGALMSQGLPPVKAEDTAKAKADKEAAQAAEAKMTPEQKAAAKKAKRAQKQKQLSHTEKVGNPNASAKGEAISKSAEATKNQPKALPDTQSKEDALKAQEKKSSGQ
jgi:cell division protein FtsN